MKHMSAKQIAYFILAVLLLLFTFIAANAQEPYIRIFTASETNSMDYSRGFFLAEQGFRFPYVRPTRFHRKFDSLGHAYYNKVDSHWYGYDGIGWFKWLSEKDSVYIKGLAASGTDAQTLSISNDTLTIIRGNSVKLPFVKIADSAAMLMPYLPKWLAAVLYQPALGFTPENVANKATNMNVLNNSLYPTTAAVNAWGNTNYQPIGTYIRAMDTATMLANYLLKTHAAALYYPLSNPNGYTSNNGTLTALSILSVNGLSGTVYNSTTTPSVAMSLDTIQTATELNGYLHVIAIADPSTPQPNTGFAYMDASHHVWNIKNDAGVVSNTAIPNAGTSGQFFKTFSADGTFTLGPAVTSVTAGTGLSGGTITGTGTISMPNTGTAGTYGSSTQVAVITTDAQGRITSVTPTTITGFQVSGNYVTFSDTTISAAYTLTSRDAFRRIHATNGSNIALTIPSGLGTTFGCEVIQEGAGTVTPAGSGATLHFATSGHTKTGGQHSAISIQMEATTDNILIQGKTQ